MMQSLEGIKAEILTLSEDVRENMNNKIKGPVLDKNKIKEIKSEIKFLKTHRGKQAVGVEVMNSINYNNKIVTFAIIGQILIALGKLHLIPPTGRNCKTKICIYAYVATHKDIMTEVLKTIAIYSKIEEDQQITNQTQRIVNEILDQLNTQLHRSDNKQYKYVVSLTVQSKQFFFAINPDKKSVKTFHQDGTPVDFSELPPETAPTEIPTEPITENNEDPPLNDDLNMNYEQYNDPFTFVNDDTFYWFLEQSPSNN